jgi:hypothetical protein
MSQIAREEGITTEGVRIALERAFMHLRVGKKPRKPVLNQVQTISRSIKRAIVQQGKGKPFTAETIVRAVQRETRMKRKEIIPVLQRVLRAAQRHQRIALRQGKYVLRSIKPA